MAKGGGLGRRAEGTGKQAIKDGLIAVCKRLAGLSALSYTLCVTFSKYGGEKMAISFLAVQLLLPFYHLVLIYGQ